MNFRALLISAIFALIPLVFLGQNYTSYFTGNNTDMIAYPAGGVCMMGGATEDDNAMKWFLQRADGGDILVLRASGSNGYNDYLYSQLGVTVNSVETIVFNNAAAADEAYIHQKINQAEAIWFAGGDQWDYVRYWRNSPVDSLINIGIKERNVVVGGTSAGMAILGGFYFTARYGTVTSQQALANPYSSLVNVDSASFLKTGFMDEVITDTHFDNPDRRGRLMVFLARIFKDYGLYSRAIACDEYTAVCVDTTGIAKVFGGYPPHQDNAYFIQSNCELSSPAPEVCQLGSPLTWDLNGNALKVYRIKGTATGTNYFDLNDWKTGNGGTWLDWYVKTGTFFEKTGDALDCSVSIDVIPRDYGLCVFPNPVSDFALISSNTSIRNCEFTLYDWLGKKIPVTFNYRNDYNAELNLSALPPGLYLLKTAGKDHHPAAIKLIVGK